MNATSTFIGYLKNEQPAIWESISNAAGEGLIVIDEENDAVTPTNRLLLTYPDLHTVLSLLVDNWIRNTTEALAQEAISGILQGRKENG